MKKIFTILVLVILLSQVFSSKAYASHGAPVGACEAGFELHHFLDHDGEHMHKHIGLSQDLNGDGYICMKIINPHLHLHVDNYLPLP